MKPNQQFSKQSLVGPQPGIYVNGRPCLLVEAGTLANRELGSGRLQAAVDIYNLILVKFPDCSEALDNRGVALNRMGQPQEALASIDRALALKPRNAKTHNNRGVALMAMKRHEEALASYDKALTLEPNLAEVHNNRGVPLLEMRRYSEALNSFEKAIMLKPDYASAHANRGAVLELMKLYDEALVSFDRALALKPDKAETYQQRGQIMVNKGDMFEAERMFRKALTLNPDLPAPLFGLANLHSHQDANNAVERQIQTLLNKPGTPAEHREYLYFALGKIYDDGNRYDDAFEYYRRANQMRNATVSYDGNHIRGMAHSVIEVFNKEFFSQRCSFQTESQSPLFIVGMPRSGTTLAASIFSNHHSIATAGELLTIADIAASLADLTGNVVPYPHAANHVTPEGASALVRAYEQRLRRDVGGEFPFVIDKHPLNFWHLGIIARLFPQAQIIHCLRHPLDTGLSNFFQRFDLTYDYSFDLTNIGHFYGEYTRIMNHWRQVLPTKLIEISYEDMILNTEHVVRRTLAQLGLDWDERCLAPHTNPCAIETASRWQVRQPIYTRSLQRWRHYDKHLEPLKEALRLNGNWLD